ncbi:hypothetical protein WR25_06495 [Diploscapter pachys]|uniref:Uncharacterized protein n=1 Tax=Diploscapter pachys TaxID=2018661 RepID=A0A2A2J3F7_9BILA|nr:hypothetical protein WR25_06495 [Diploscapter pachys]
MKNIVIRYDIGVMSASKQQASLLSFFKRTPTSGSADQSSQSPSRSPATSKPSATAFKTPTSSKKGQF